MSKHGPCTLSHHNEPAVAWWKTGNGAFTRLCQACLDYWFDNADDDPSLEPVAWGWFHRPAAPSLRDITAWARDPRNQRELAAALRVEARINPGWLRAFMERENRIHQARTLR